MPSDEQDAFNRLRGTTSPASSPYAFQGGPQPTRTNPTPQSRPFQPTSRPETGTGPRIFKPERTVDGDRPRAYEMPVKQEEQGVYEWTPPTFRDILVDLGLRVLEVTIAAAALAAADEIAYFFKKRRLHPKNPPNYRER